MSALAARLAARLWRDESTREAFLAALSRGDGGLPVDIGAETGGRDGLPEWTPEWVSRRTGAAGEQSYGLDFSSVWEMQALSVVPRPVRRVLDVCAAPGGKSVLASRHLAPGFHLANEVVPKRLGILRHNLSRCGIAAHTQRWDPARLAVEAPEAFDGVLVDAPCSGQSLLARGVENQGCFHPATVKGNAMRQRGILSSSAACVAPGGWLVYSTCTFSPDENGKNMRWFGRRFEDFELIEVPDLKLWESEDPRLPGYTLYPQQGLGSGGFVCVWRKRGERSELPELSTALTEWPVAGRE
ncbi:16S rRNA C967 or C1407 C5-methylase (RsmB/RsmF family) [Haloferula luteola]|uniref:16S rRNA C967 or C1407 C5-methylase (RsmB/RsmF family) n=1 Tax=Haloferula luteola TaxID=595692 RepID=A0A840VC93_9BACT|nr:RsmB/NOP family class I SAM-dependent RNA methyltransferase [Haloferula luteola]MBB5351429.1 16S rRNA C967 or C1407 C5-methylase (RsmB/RsmF family) [Haloferula luteola]